MDYIKALFGWLLPPRFNATPEQVYRWRVKLVVVTMANALVTGSAIALSLGLVPVVTLGFAPRTAVEGARTEFSTALASQNAQWREVRRSQVDSKILDTRIRQCAAIKARDHGQDGAELVVQFATERLQEQLQAYWDLMHQRYRVPDCSEV